MNRQTRRHQQRAVLRDLRGYGCSCTPSIKIVSDSLRPPWAISGAAVRHELGCPFGDRFVPFNDAGLASTVVSEGGRRCAR